MLDSRVLTLGGEKPYNGLEDDVQRACATYLKAIGHSFFWCHIPNEEKRSGRRTASQKGKGLIPGAPDLVILMSKGGYHGLIVELKIWPKKPDPLQEIALNKCAKQDYLCAVVYSRPAFEKLITGYINGIYTKTETQKLPA